ncbi:MAG: restriction endonuclease subunit S [Bacteroidales bacterium]|nr:restriction endonuclease subunit S [Bacteroidales bacterium]
MAATKYKDSGIPWIGLIPEDWEVKRLKHIANKITKGNGITKEEVFADGETPCVRYGEIYSKYENSFSQCFSRTRKENLSALHFFHYGDILCAGTGELVEEIGKSIIYLGNENCLAGGDIIILSPNQNPIFLNFALNSKYVQSQKSCGKAKLKVVHISASDIGNLLIALPPLPTQQRIADFLDRKCAEIDELAALQETMIAELKRYKQSVITEAVTKGLDPDVPMKDSGVEWIGEVPEGWEVCRLKDILKRPLQYGANESGIPYNEELPRYVRITDILENSLREDLIKQSLSEEQAAGYILEDNDILFARSGGTVGKAFIYKQKYGRCAFAGYLIKAAIEKGDAQFIYYYTQSHCYEEWKRRIFIQATIQNIGADRYSIMELPIPPLTEQQAIADYLDEKCSEIDELIAIKQQKIEQLKEYKKSVIFEYVTGKKEVKE